MRRGDPWGSGSSTGGVYVTDPVAVAVAPAFEVAMAVRVFAPGVSGTAAE